MNPKQARKITKSVVGRLPIPEKGYTITRDTELRGFGVRVTANGARSFILERRVKGRVRRFTVGRYGPDFTVDMARKKAETLGGEIAAGKDPDEERRRAEAEAVTLQKAVNAYLGTRPLKQRTVADVKECMQSLDPWMNRRLTELTAGDVLRKHRELSKGSLARANLTMRYLMAVWNFARALYTTPRGEPILNGNPVAALSELRAWNRVERRKTVVKKDQLHPWMEAVLELRSTVCRDLLLVLVLTGLRRGEAQELTWDRVNLTDAPLIVLDADGNEEELAPSSLVVFDTKAKRPHTPPLGTYLLELLKTRRKSISEDCPWVFANKAGNHLSDPYCSVRSVVERSGVEFCLHDLRRTFATVAESLDLSVYAVKRLLNHSTKGDVTAGYLSEGFDTDRLRAPMQLIEDTILRLGGVEGGGEVVLRQDRMTSSTRPTAEKNHG